MKRRDALKTMGALAGAPAGTRLLGACGDNGLPPGIEHIVVVMMENRSYDHLLGARALEGLGGDGLTATMPTPGATARSTRRTRRRWATCACPTRRRAGTPPTPRSPAAPTAASSPRTRPPTATTASSTRWST